MDSGGAHTMLLEQWLRQLRAADRDEAAFDRARSAVIEHACQRLESLTARMLRRYPRLRRWEQTADVLQNSLLRLHRSLATVQPATPREFYGLAATQIRRELIDLARHHFGPHGDAARHHTDRVNRGGAAPAAALERPSDPTGEPATLAEWTEFHELVERLPPAEREVFDLLWYEGLSQLEAAAILNVSDRTIKTRWRSAKLALRDLLDGTAPQ